MIKRHLTALLKDDPAIRNMVDGRIFPGRARQGNKQPYVILSTDSGTPFNDIPGEAQQARSSIEVEVFADTDRQANEISEAIRQRLSGYSGPAGEAYVCGCMLEGSPSGRVNSPIDGSDNWIYISMANYDVIYDQPPTLNNC